MANTSTPKDYMPQLDALRFFAVVGVMVVHNWHPNRLPWLFGDLDWGGLGVRLFFVLSGFLITGILYRCRSLADGKRGSSGFFIRQFYIRRFLRIFPIYYLTIFLAFIFDVPGTRAVWGWLATYTSNIYITINNTWIGRMGHFWSLAVEEHFYLLWPWIVLFFPRKWLIPIMLLIIPIGPIYRAFAYNFFPFDIGAMDFKAGTLTPGVLDSLGLGALLALLWNANIPRKTLQKYINRLVLPVGLLLFLFSLILYHYRIKPSVYFVIGDFSSALIFVWLVSAAASGFKGRIGRILEYRPLLYLGKITYGIYVYHNLTPLILITIFDYFGIPLQVPGFPAFVLSSLLTIALSIVSWHLIELPINSLKRHFEYMPKSAPDKPEVVLAADGD